MGTLRTVIIGTAGHIDHGKSSVVRALTGIDPDRLAEERERGMTIDLGFAPYEHGSGATVGLIDVPGHERFIKNMVAGSTSVDLALLIVAADDGVMPQTREHLAILRLLGVSAGLVALTKIDLVDEELVELAQEDVADFVAGTFLEGAPILPVSAVTGQGLDVLRATLDELVSAVPPREPVGPFRLPIQRVFSAKGHGLVVTGVPVSGRVAVGDELELVGTGQTGRVRGIQAYGAQRDEGRAGHSTALNLAGIDQQDVRRGDQLASPGHFEASRFLALDYTQVEGAPALRHHHPVRVHLGTAEVMGRAVRLDGELAEPGEAGRVQVRLAERVSGGVGDPVLLRDAASMEVLGGGRLLALTGGRLKRFKERVLAELEERAGSLGDPLALARVALAAAGPRGLSLERLLVEAGCDEPTLVAGLERARDDGDLMNAGDHWFTREGLDQVEADLLAAVAAEHKRRPLLDWANLAAVRARCGHAEQALRLALQTSRRLESEAGGKLRRKGHRGKLGSALAEVRQRVLDGLRDGGTKPPTIDADFTGLDRKDHAALMEMLLESGEVAKAGPLLFDPGVLASMRATLEAHAAARDGAIEVPELRDELQTSRKFIIPLLEHWDAEGLTVRHGDQRRLRGGGRG